MPYERMLDKEHQPTEQEILETIDDAALWLQLREYLGSAYDVTPELTFGGKKYGWAIRYRKSGRTLCSLLPERGAFSALVILGKKETEKAFTMLDQFNANIHKVFEETPQLHDGRWLWIRVQEQSDVDGVIELLKLKRKPKQREQIVAATDLAISG